MQIDQLIFKIQHSFAGVIVKKTYGETTFFYNPNSVLPNGVYFCTIKENDGPNDRSSNLSADGGFRLSFKPDPITYEKFFGKKPKRPKKGQAIEAKTNLSTRDEWMPHAVYAWMGWTMVISPSDQTLTQIWPYLLEAYLQAKSGFEKKLKASRV